MNIIMYFHKGALNNVWYSECILYELQIITINKHTTQIDFFHFYNQ